VSYPFCADTRAALDRKPEQRWRGFGEVAGGGAKRGRTADLLNAIQALYQLSYGPALREAAK
jgi:hypothetical protein